MDIDDDKILSIALHERDERAFDIVFQKYYKSIYYFVYRNCKSSEDAEELTQDVFVKLWENSKDTPVVSLRAYLYTLARGTVIDWIRKDVNQLIFDKLVDNQHYTLITESGVEEKVRIEHQLSIVHQTAQSMPEKRLEVYRLRWIEGLSRKEIASRMGITVTTVDIHLKKACDYLKETIQANPKGNDY